MTTFRLAELPWPYSLTAFVLSIIMIVVVIYYLVKKR